MRLIGFNFEKMNSERFSDSSESLKYNTKIDLSNISTLKSGFIKLKDEILKVSFNYSVSYEPNYAKIELTGHLLISIEPKLAREILRDWQDKKTPEDFRIFLFNVIIRKANIKALQLEDDLGLPPHVPFPSLKKQEPKEEKQ